MGQVTVRVKICGVKDEAGLDAALSAGANYVGFVFFPKSPRHLSLGAAAALAERARGRAGIVAVTVDPDDDLLLRIHNRVAPDYVQLHGYESPKRVAEVRQIAGAAVIKAIPVATPADVASANDYREIADLMLYDGLPPRGCDLPGGNGIGFDPALLQGAPGPYLLSGGLNPDNVGVAIARLRPFAVDVSSGVERAPGEKDAGLIARFIAAVRTETALAS